MPSWHDIFFIKFNDEQLNKIARMLLLRQLSKAKKVWPLQAGHRGDLYSRRSTITRN
jgi:hypothetical protein